MSHVKGFLTGIVIPIILGLIIAFFIRTFIFQFNTVNGESMTPSFQHGDYLLTEKISTYFGNYNRGDIVIADTHDDKYIIKRLIGIPGDTIEFIPANSEGNEKSYLRLNGEILNETYIKEEMNIPKHNSITVSENHYFVLGDNRNESADSRVFGLFQKNDIKGTVFLELRDKIQFH